MKDGLPLFALKFAAIAAILLLVFHFVFPYYRMLLMAVAGALSDAADVRTPGMILLTFMPYVSLSALILATPKRTKKEKTKFILLMFGLFFLIDISFSIAQIFVQSGAIPVFQEYFTIAMPIVIWFLMDHKNLIAEKAD